MGAGKHFFIFVVFKQVLERDVYLPKLNSLCRGLRKGCKAVASRGHDDRTEHRRARAAAECPVSRPIVRPVVTPSPVPEEIEEVEGEPVEVKLPSSCQEPPVVPNRIRVGTHNWCGSAFAEIAERDRHYAKAGLDVVGVTEHKLNPKNIKFLTSRGYAWLAEANKLEEGGVSKGGVGFLVSLHLQAYVTLLKPTFKDQLWIRINPTSRSADRPIFVCVAYMPQENDPSSAAAWAALGEAAAHYASLGEIVILGDLNGKVGTRLVEERGLLGSHLPKVKRSGNGYRLMEVARSCKLRILNSFSSPPGESYWHTRTEPGTGKKSQLDYILVSPFGGDVPSFKVDYTDLASDHHLVSADLLCARKRSRRKKQRKHKRFNLSLLTKVVDESEGAPSPRAAYGMAVAAELVGFDPVALAAKGSGSETDRAGRVVADLIQRVKRAAESSLGSKTVHKRYQRPWFDKEVKAAITKRRALYQRWGSEPSMYPDYVEAMHAVRALVKRKKAEYKGSLVSKLCESYGADMRAYWKLSQLYTPKSTKVNEAPLRRADGTMATFDEDKGEVWAGFREDLGQPPQDPFFDEDFFNEVNSSMKDLAKKSHASAPSPLDAPFVGEEVRRALHKLKLHKAAGLDAVKNELLKFGGEAMADTLLALFNWLRVTESFPRDWGKAVLVQLYKDGDMSDPGNYRGISLISCLGKLYLSLWTERLTRMAESRLSDMQGGFRSKRAGSEQTFALYESLVRRKRAKKKTFLFFIDFRKAFDRVWWNGLWKALFDMGVQGKAWRIIRGIYSDIRSSTLVGGQPSRWIGAHVGVRQGCPLSPILFNLFVDSLAKELESCDGGIEVLDNLLPGLLYADDICLTASSAEQLQRMITICDNWCRKWRMEINLKKSKVMVVLPPRTPRDDHTWTFRERPVEVVSEYKYLGMVISDTLLWNKHVTMVVSKAKMNSWKVGRLLTLRGLSLRAKKLVWDAKVRSGLEYGAELMQLDSKDAKKIESVQHQAYLRILSLKSKSKREAVVRLLGAQSLETRRACSKLKFFQRLNCLDSTRWPHRVFSEPLTKQKVQGRTNKRWLSATRTIIESGAELEEAATELEESVRAARVHLGDRTLRSILHVDLEAQAISTDTDDELAPEVERLLEARRAWRKGVLDWGWDKEHENLLAASRGQRSTCVLLAHLFKDRSLITKRPRAATGAATRLDAVDKIRARLLSGTNSLNFTMGRARRGSRSTACPCEVADTDGIIPEETVQHFLLHCPLYAVQRAELAKEILEKCACEQNECNALWAGQDLDKCCLILGGPFADQPVDETVDDLCKKFVSAAWATRSAKLTTISEVDVQNPVNPPLPSVSNQPSIDSFFIRPSSPPSKRRKSGPSPQKGLSLQQGKRRAEVEAETRPAKRSRASVSDRKQGGLTTLPVNLYDSINQRRPYQRVFEGLYNQTPSNHLVSSSPLKRSRPTPSDDIPSEK
jgi:hypothetical protein